MTDYYQLTIRTIEHRLSDGSYVYDVAIIQDHEHQIILKATSARDAEQLVDGLESVLLRRTINTVNVRDMVQGEDR